MHEFVKVRIVIIKNRNSLIFNDDTPTLRGHYQKTKRELFCSTHFQRKRLIFYVTMPKYIRKLQVKMNRSYRLMFLKICFRDIAVQVLISGARGFNASLKFGVTLVYERIIEFCINFRWQTIWTQKLCWRLLTGRRLVLCFLAKFNALFESLFRVLVVVSLVFFQCQVSSLCDPGYEAKFSEDGLSSLCFERCQCQQDVLFRFITTISTFEHFKISCGFFL